LKNKAAILEFGVVVGCLAAVILLSGQLIKPAYEVENVKESVPSGFMSDRE
jgi:hypothetical protein